MKKYYFLIIFICNILFTAGVLAQGSTCVDMQAFCTDSGISFPATTGIQDADIGNDYACLEIPRNPAWYYIQIDQPGNMQIELTNIDDNAEEHDIDFIVYGPFASLQAAQNICGAIQATETPCPTSQICPNGVPCDFEGCCRRECTPILGIGFCADGSSCTNGDICDLCVTNDPDDYGFGCCIEGDGVDCSYDPQDAEVVDIPNAQVGEVYIFVITNFDNMPTNIFANKIGGTATTDCSIIQDCRDVEFSQGPPSTPPIPLPATIDCTDAPIQIAAIAANLPPNQDPVANDFITPAFGIEISTDINSATENTLELWDQPNGTGNLIGYKAPTNMGGSYSGPLPDDEDYVFYGEYLDPTVSYSIVWCDNAGTGSFDYQVIDYSPDTAPDNVMASGTFDHANSNCFTVNIGSPVGTATFTGSGITDTGTGIATFDPSSLNAGLYAITYSWDDGDGCSGTQMQTIEITCNNCNVSGGEVVGTQTVELCADDDPYTLSTINEMTDPSTGRTEVLWVVWVLEDPLGMTGVPNGGPLPDDDLFAPNEDINYIGLWNNNGQIVTSNSIEIIPDGSGVTYYIAPIIGTPDGQFDILCTGLDPNEGYTVYMNPPLGADVNTNNCDITIDLLGGFPSVDNTADYSWSYTDPNGVTTTGTGASINITSGTNGDYLFSITDDGLGCSLLDFTSVTFTQCNCEANAGTFNINTQSVCYDNEFIMISNNDFSGSFEDGTSADNTPGDGDMYNGVGYAIFSDVPSGVYAEDDPNFVGILGTSPAPGGQAQNSIGAFVGLTIINGNTGTTTTIQPNSTYYFTTIYSFDVDGSNGDDIAIYGFGVGGGIDCFDSNADQAIAVTFLDSISAVITQTCNMTGGVEISFQLSGGHPDFNGSNYTITGDGPQGTVAPNGTYTISDHPPETPYIIVVGDEGGQGCSRAFQGFSLAAPTVDVSNFTDETCQGANDGTATALPGSGTAPYNFEWSNGAMTATASGLSAGNYTVTVTDSEGCTVIGDMVTIMAGSAMTLTALADSVTCADGSDGSITAMPMGGTEPYNYQWSGSPGGTPTVGGLTAGVYTVTVTDVNGCEATASAEVEQPVAIGAFLENETDPACFGESTGSIDGVVTGGVAPFTYTWSNGQMTESITGLTAGFYGLTIEDANGCVATASTTLAEPSLLTTQVNLVNNASCEGSMDGALVAEPNGGTEPYNFTWSHDNTLNAPGANNLNPGSYAVTVTDAQGCVATADGFIASTVVITDSGTTQDVNCNGESSGSITANPEGSTNLPYTYTWSANANTGNVQTATGLSADTYFLTITDAAGCTGSAQYVVNEPTELLIAASVDNNILCNGETNGQASVTANGGTPDAAGNYNYQWSDGQNTAMATNLSAGMYSVTVTDDNGCEKTDEVEIIEPEQLNLILGSNEISCFGGSDGFVTATPQGGTPDANGNYDYEWSANANGQSTATAFNLPIGIYMVTVTDDSGCIATGEVELVEPPLLVATVNADEQVTCNGGNDGQATASATGGTLDFTDPNADYTYEWSASAGSQTTATATNLPAGTHSVTLTDFKDCEDIVEVIITEPDILLVNISIDNNVNCNAGNNGQLTANAQGGTPNAAGSYTYQWDANAANQSTATAGGLMAGTYTVTVTDDNGCTVTGEATITEPDALTLDVTADTNVNCNGSNDGSATASPSGGTPDANGNYTYQWDTNAGGFATASVSNLAAGTYTVTVTDDNGCEIIGSVDITEPGELTVMVNLNNNVNCDGGNDGSATAVPSGGTPDASGNYTYEWSASAGSQITALANNLPVGMHTVTVTDANGCTNTGSIDITAPNALDLNVEANADVKCAGGTDGSATAIPTGGTPDAAGNYNYEWSASAGNQMTDAATNLPAGMHTVTVTDDSGCTITGEVEIMEPPLLEVNINTDNNVGCNSGNDGQATATATGGTPDATGNYTYQWDAAANNQMTATAGSLIAGTYSVTVTDANGCTAENMVEITEPQAITSTIDAMNVSCNGGDDASATVTPTGGTPDANGEYSYQWSANAGGVFTASVSNLTAGIYMVSITDMNNCTLVETITITEPDELTIAVSDVMGVLCNGQTNGTATVTSMGGTPPYEYEWGGSGETTETAVMLPAGMHIITVTDLNNCTITAEVEIIEPDELNLDLTGTDPSCFGETNGSIMSTVEGGTMPYNYAWSDGQASDTATDLPAGNHSLIVTDANGCTVNGNLTLVEPPQIVLDISTSLTNCVGDCDGEASVLANGGTGGFSYLWDNGETTDNASALCAGEHTLTVTDASGCMVIDTFMIENPVPIFPGGSSMPVSCFGGSDGSVTMTPTGGIPSYTYEWFTDSLDLGTDSGPSSSIDSLPAGIYTVVVTDANGCQTPPINITIVQPAAPLTLTASGQAPNCNGGDDGFVTVEPEGGTPSYAYQWSAETGFQDTQTALNLPLGTYSVTVSDENGCTDTISVSIDEPTDVTMQLSSMPATCFGDANGIIVVEGTTGGMEPYTYSLDGEIFTPDTEFFGLAAGLYTVYVQDAGMCVYTDEILVEQPFEVIVDAGMDETILFGDSVQLSAQINQPPGNNFGLSWSPAAGLDCTACDAPIASPLDDMTYIVTATDSITGCTASDEITVFINKDRNVYIPNIFSPNGDGSNDVFMIFGGAGVTNVVSFRIYDRWGELLFEAENFGTNDPEQGWDGTYRGRDLNPGVFVYVAEIEFIDGISIPYKGDVTLMR